MIQRYNHPDVILDKGLFTIFRQMQLEDQVNQVRSVTEAGSQNVSALQTPSDGPSIFDGSKQTGSPIKRSHETSLQEVEESKEEGREDMLESFKQRDIFQVHMLQQAQAVIDAEDSQMKMYRSKFHEQLKDLEDLKKLLASKNDKINSLEEEKISMQDQLKGYTIWKDKYHKIMKQIESQQNEIRKLKIEKKEMSMTYHKELTVQKMQATMFLK